MDLQESLPFIHVALPVLNEPQFLRRAVECISSQTYRRFRVLICVNQPESWWKDPAKSEICLTNEMTLDWLKTLDPSRFYVIDRASRGRGWSVKNSGIGWARKVIMDMICEDALPGDLILSLDADTAFNENYFLSVALNFFNNPDAVALSAPYFHMISLDERAYRAILRYEIYMRHYQLNLWRIGSPYTFTALGSAIACPVWAYKAIGGMTPKTSGEDFYFLQKLRKYGRILFWNDEKVFPEARFSDRVFFGTGPAMIKGDAGDWSSYPIYASELFNEIWETYELFPSFFRETSYTPVVRFLSESLREKDPFQPLRKNFKTEDNFMRACHEKFDGLRLLQYLKSNQDKYPGTDEEHLLKFLNDNYDPMQLRGLDIDFSALSFENSNLADLEKIRLLLFEKEEESRFISALY
ncbi:MAG: glycosyltransferase family A protein [Bacteroidota bacterium]